MTRIPFIQQGLVAAILVSCAGQAVLAAAPLLMEGKKTLYQRVLTHPGAQLRDTPGASGQPLAKACLLYTSDAADE